ncbi:hypothetical protein KEJ49_01775 [Candidatus Bathyarchaeota archaeon]|nr:hypothetical protein [Candidatus Bathyarchaeota archaeon]
MTAQELFRILGEVLFQIANEVVRLLPRLLAALVIIALTLMGIRIVNLSFRKLLALARLDEMFKQLSGFSLPFSIDSLIIFLADLGISLISLYAMVGLFLPSQHLHLMNEGLAYGARVLSVILLAVILLAIFNSIVGRIRVEARLRSYAMFIVLLLVTAMLVDITALSEQVKNELIGGLSLGVGISIGVFAIWFFFHEYFDELIRRR